MKMWEVEVQSLLKEIFNQPLSSSFFFFWIMLAYFQCFQCWGIQRFCKIFVSFCANLSGDFIDCTKSITAVFGLVSWKQILRWGIFWKCLFGRAPGGGVEGGKQWSIEVVGLEREEGGARIIYQAECPRQMFNSIPHGSSGDPELVQAGGKSAYVDAVSHQIQATCCSLCSPAYADIWVPRNSSMTEMLVLAEGDDVSSRANVHGKGKEISYHLVKAMLFPVVMYGCESWTIKKAESWRIDAFELWCWRRLLRVT